MLLGLCAVAARPLSLLWSSLAELPEAVQRSAKMRRPCWTRWTHGAQPLPLLGEVAEPSPLAQLLSVSIACPLRLLK